MSLTRRFVLTGLIAAPAVIAMARLMPVQSIIKPYATVWGVGWDLEVIEHQIWKPMSVAQFGSPGGAIDQFREVTQWVYGFPVDTSSQPPLSHWHSVPKKNRDPMLAPRKFDEPPVVLETGYTTIASFESLRHWRGAQRSDLGELNSQRWVQEQLAGERKYKGCV